MFVVCAAGAGIVVYVKKRAHCDSFAAAGLQGERRIRIRPSHYGMKPAGPVDHHTGAGGCSAQGRNWD